jgi:hypothetical protein
MNEFPSFIEPVLINGKLFERSDVPEAVKSVSAQLCAAHQKPAHTKVRAAKFLLAAEQGGYATLAPNIRSFCKQLTK